MRAIERITGEFDGRGIGRIEVPEWGEEGQPLIITFTAVTAREHRKIYSFPDGEQRPLAMAAVEALLLKARDERGERLFSEADRQALETRASANVVLRVAGEIMAAGRIRDVEKN